MDTKIKNRQLLAVALPTLLILELLAVFLVTAPGAPEETQAVPFETSAPPRETAVPAPLPQTAGEAAVRAYALEKGIPCDAWPESLIELLDRNPETEEFVLNYPEMHGQPQEIDLSEFENSDGVPLFLQWDTRWGYLTYGSDVAGITGCGPVCLSMAAYYLTGDPEMSPDNMIRFALENGYCVPGNGSSWTLISEGGPKLGLDVTEIPLMESRILANLEVGNPIICVLGPGDFTDSGHFVVMVGCENGKLRINDPNSRERSEKLWDYSQIESQILNLWVIRKL